MQIRLWSAFASNNSGSYTIVGRFREIGVARELAHLLGPLLEAQTRWLDDPAHARPSPLERLAGEEGLAWGADEENDWPRYGGKAAPEVVLAGHQVLVHHDYTVTLPRLFGALICKRGGVVDVTLDHAHHPVVAEVSGVWPWAARDRAGRAVADLEAVVVSHGVPGASLVRTSGDAFDPPVQVVAVFHDLVAGVDAAREVIERHGGRVHVALREAVSRSDPVAPWRA